MNSLKKQRGMSFWVISLLIVVVLFFATLFVKLGPIYFDQYYLNDMVAAAGEQPGSLNKSIADIRTGLQKNLSINAVSFDLKFLTKDKKAKVLILEYEKQVKIMFNVDAVVKFRKEYDLTL